MWWPEGVIPTFLFIPKLDRYWNKHTECTLQSGNQNQTHLPWYDLFIDLNGLVSKERRVACCHLIDEYAQRPPVHCLVIPLVDRTRGITKRGGTGRGEKDTALWTVNQDTVWNVSFTFYLFWGTSELCVLFLNPKDQSGLKPKWHWVLQFCQLKLKTTL